MERYTTADVKSVWTGPKQPPGQGHHLAIQTRSSPRRPSGAGYIYFGFILKNMLKENTVQERRSQLIVDQ